MKKIGLILALAVSVQSVNTQENVQKYAELITDTDLAKHLNILASDSLEGRETGEKGQKMAADYIRTHFQSLNIPAVEGLNGKGYYQEFPLSIQPPNGSFINIGTDSIYDFFKDFYHFRGFSDGVYATDTLLFLGYGIEDEGYNDYKGVDVKGRIIVILHGTPKALRGTDAAMYWKGNWRTKVELAKKKGVKAVLIIDEHFEQNTQLLDHYVNSPYVKLVSDTTKEKYAPNFYISPAMAEELFLGTKYSFQKAKKKSQKKPYSFELKKSVEVVVKRKKRVLTSENVLGYIEGTDKKEELIILTAHYDHLGKKDGKIYNGADDDGSGTAAIMDIAESFMKAKAEGYGPRRSVLIMPVAGEEKGLLGSKFYTDNPVFPLENTVANLNIDMIGRLDTAHDNGDYIYLIGSDKLSSELHSISEKANIDYTKLDLDYTFNDKNDPNRFYYRSDHYNFAKNKVPVIFYFNGVHADYHKHTDTVDKIDFKKMETITRLVFYTAWELANREGRIVVDSNKE